MTDKMTDTELIEHIQGASGATRAETELAERLLAALNEMDQVEHAVQEVLRELRQRGDDDDT